MTSQEQERVVVHPGDKLIVRVSGNPTMADADRMRTSFAEQLPGVDVVLVVAEQLLVYRPGADGSEPTPDMSVLT